ncbi:Flp pilus assembly protein CpaB [Basilea psittacipulmonis]|uniref:Flp pilus assembly protein CpaB n=1 Tax=Basilea psittacipulmonis TaxID=1472345 RepID=UPI000689EB54|nr:Flp pilus assembly protein CpaB [Basilea psittacipulmonis]
MSWIKIHKKQLLLLLISLVAGIILSFLIKRHFAMQFNDQGQVAKVARIVADRDISAGTILTTQMLSLREIPAEFKQSSSFAASALGAVENKILQKDLKRGDLILQAHLSANVKPFSHSVGTGRRAITIPIDELNSASGMIVPGDLIDLYVSFEYQKKRITAPLLQGVLVMATGKQNRYIAQEGREESYDTVTLDTSPEEAVQLVAARESGEITAMLRNPQDKHISSKGVKGNLAQMLGISPHKTSNKPVVIYAKSQRIPNKNKPDATDLKKGLFDLPDTQDLVSDWINSLPKESE